MIPTSRLLYRQQKLAGRGSLSSKQERKAEIQRCREKGDEQRKRYEEASGLCRTRMDTDQSSHTQKTFVVRPIESGKKSESKDSCRQRSSSRDVCKSKGKR